MSIELIIAVLLIVLQLITLFLLGFQVFNSERSSPPRLGSGSQQRHPETKPAGGAVSLDVGTRNTLSVMHNDIGKIRNTVDTLYRNLQTLNEEFSSLRARVSATPATEKPRATQPASACSDASQVPEPVRPPQALSPMADTLVSEFNRDAKQLMQSHRGRMGIANAEEYRKWGAPQFQEAANGDYMLVADGGELYGLPLHRNNYSTSVFASGGFLELFEPDGHQQGYSYRRIRMISPAVLTRNGERLDVKSKGKLELLEGTPEA